MKIQRSEGTQYIIISFIVALMLEVMPLPGALVWWRPSFVLLTMIFWSMNFPYRANVGVAFIAGLLVDLFFGDLLGSHAFVFVVIAYLVAKFNHPLKLFPLPQQMLFVCFLLVLQQIVLTVIQMLIHQSSGSMLPLLSVLTSTAIWPLVLLVLNGLVNRFKIS